MNKYTTVEEFLADQTGDKKTQIDLLRALIIKTHAGLSERLKWNAPSYVLNGEDRITFNLMNKEGAVKLVLHMGATRKENKKGTPLLTDDKGLLDWQSDIRGIVTFKNSADVKSKSADIADVIKRWLAIA